MNKAVFLDRDGVIVETKDFITKTDEIKIFSYAPEAIKRFNRLGYKVIVVTNQSAVARALCTEEEIKTINNEIIRVLKNEGAIIDAVYYCPHHPEKQYGGNLKYRIECDCRKPKTGMFERAKKDFNLDFSTSFVVGDQTIDVKAGESIGCRTLLVETGYGGQDKKIDIKPDFVCKDLLDASKYIELLDKLSVIILVGGKGDRLRPLTDTIPKPLIPINGKPILQYQIELLRDYGVRKIVICGHYLFEKIKDFFGDGSKFGVEIKYIEESSPLGTGGAIKNAETLISGPFFVFMGDILTNLNLTSVIDFHIKSGGLGTLVLRETDHPEDSDLVKIDKNNKVLRLFKKTEKNKEGNLANTGFFVFNKDFLDLISNGVSNLEGDIIYNCVNSSDFYGYVSHDYIKDIGTFKRYEEVQRDIDNGLYRVSTK